MMIDSLLALAILVAPGAEQPLLPLTPGFHWKYQFNGRYTVDMVVSDRGEIQGSETTRVRSGIQSGGFFEAVSWSADRGHLLEHAWHSGSYTHINDPPVPLIQSPLAVGQKWEGHQDEFGLRVEVLGKERLTTPAGTFEAWKIGYTHSFHLGHTHDTTMWFTPGVGFVKVELVQESRGWDPTVKTPLETPRVFELAAFGMKPDVGYPALTPVQQKRAEQLIDRLGELDEQVVEAARRELLSLECAILPVLFEQLYPRKTSKRQAEVRSLIDEFGTLSVLGHARNPQIKVGEALPVEFRIRNDFPIPVQALPLLYSTHLNSSKCYPRFLIEIQDEQGNSIDFEPPPLRCGVGNTYRLRHLVQLQPGEEFDPLGASVAYMPGVDPPERLDLSDARLWSRHYILNWFKTEKPGRYTIRCIYDVSSALPRGWYRIRKSLPRGRYESNPVIVEVIEQPD